MNPAAGEVGPLATAFLLREDEHRPGLFLGTSSDRIGSPEGEQAYFATASKHFEPVRLGLYASLNYSEWDASFNLPFGGSLFLPANIYLRSMYDGERSHLIGGWSGARIDASVLLVWLDTWGGSLAMGF